MAALFHKKAKEEPPRRPPALIRAVCPSEVLPADPVVAVLARELSPGLETALVPSVRTLFNNAHDWRVLARKLQKKGAFL